MIFVDADIRTRCERPPDGGPDFRPMIEPFAPPLLQNCRYNLTAGRAFLPESGDEQLVPADDAGKRRMHWTIEPTETLVFQTRERIRVPANVMAMYGQLNRLANKGLNLINESIIEPGYDGFLSCLLVNLSKEPVRIAPGDEIAKITFHTLSGTPERPVTLLIDEEPYARTLSEAAALYPRSFLDIDSLQDKIANQTTESVKKSITFGGVFLAVLIAWSSIEPIVSRYLWEHSGAVLDTSSAEVQRLREEVNALNDEQKTSATVTELQKKIDALTQRLDRLPGPKK
jgi:deoxycytidine triphosphate deaminase